MTVIAVTSWRGVGTTTTGLLLAAAVAASGSEAWFVEADAAGGVLASRADGLDTSGGLERVAFAASDEPAHRSLANCARRLGQVNVVTGSWDPFQAWSTIASPRRPWVAGLARLDGTVVVDVGSMRGGNVPAWRVLDIADVVLVVATPEPASLTATVSWIDSKGQTSPGLAGLSTQPRLVVVDAPLTTGERFGPDVAGELGDRLVGWWPWEPKVIDHIHRGGGLDHRSIRRFALPRAAHATVESLLGRTRVQETVSV